MLSRIGGLKKRLRQAVRTYLGSRPVSENYTSSRRSYYMINNRLYDAKTGLPLSLMKKYPRLFEDRNSIIVKVIRTNDNGVKRPAGIFDPYIKAGIDLTIFEGRFTKPKLKEELRLQLMANKHKI